jgi:hypothetical protein
MNNAPQYEKELLEALRIRYRLPSVFIEDVTEADCHALPFSSAALNTDLLPALTVDLNVLDNWLDTGKLRKVVNQ